MQQLRFVHDLVSIIAHGEVRVNPQLPAPTGSASLLVTWFVQAVVVALMVTSRVCLLPRNCHAVRAPSKRAAYKTRVFPGVMERGESEEKARKNDPPSHRLAALPQRFLGETHHFGVMRPFAERTSHSRPFRSWSNGRLTAWCAKPRRACSFPDLSACEDLCQPTTGRSFPPAHPPTLRPQLHSFAPVFFSPLVLTTITRVNMSTPSPILPCTWDLLNRPCTRAE